MSDVLSRIIVEIEGHYGKVIKPFLPHVVPSVNDPREMPQGRLLVRWY